MFPVHAKCATHEAGWPAGRENARRALEIGRVYTIRTMEVGQSDTTLTFYEIPGQWSSAFFDAYAHPADDEDAADAGDRAGEWAAEYCRERYGVSEPTGMGQADLVRAYLAGCADPCRPWEA